MFKKMLENGHADESGFLMPYEINDRNSTHGFSRTETLLNCVIAVVVVISVLSILI